MKKIFSIALAIALAFSVVAPVATSAQSMSNAFNTNLKLGARGADVVMLQSFLESKGLLTMPAGVAKGYFGGLTKSAVVAFQISMGVTPASGYFGPLTRATANADTTGTTTTTTCPAGFTCTANAGTTTTVTTSGVEGTADLRLAPTPTDNSNIRTQNDVSVYGVEVRARIAPVAVQTMDLNVVVSTNSNYSSQENPSTLINTIKVWDGSSVIATVPVNSSTFVKDSDGVYYVRISGLNFLVAQDVTKNLVVSFSTNSIDTARYVKIKGYGNSSIRTVSGNGISSFYSISGFERQHTFQKPGTSTLTLSSAGTTLRSQNYRSNGVDDLIDIPVATFNLKSQSGDSKLVSITASTTASGTAPSRLGLYNGSTLLKEVNLTSGNAVFNNLDTISGSTIPGTDSPVTFTIKASYPSTVTNGSYSSTTVNVVTYEKPNGTTDTASGSAVSSANQYVYSKAAMITLAGTPTITAQNAAISGGTSTVTAVFPLNIAARGGNVIIPGNADVTVTFSNGQTATALNTSVVTIPNNNIADGSSANVTVTAKSAGFAAGLYNAAITSISWNAGNGTTTQTYGLDDFKTSAAANQQ
ncbi:MAG: peptidoglycan-binding protein [Candidatus Pacebacteria bacterium]|nr:peptidoglycan-binding protein [Candidatus Paceibacterota bacterium]MBP9818966.1 peptidoglycan-binding protein [Candidatus Paceibacterota bacterium]